MGKIGKIGRPNFVIVISSSGGGGGCLPPPPPLYIPLVPVSGSCLPSVVVPRGSGVRPLRPCADWVTKIQELTALLTSPDGAQFGDAKLPHVNLDTLFQKCSEADLAQGVYDREKTLFTLYKVPRARRACRVCPRGGASASEARGFRWSSALQSPSRGVRHREGRVHRRPKQGTTPEQAIAEGPRRGGVGTRPRYLIVCLWRRLLASRHCSS